PAVLDRHSLGGHSHCPRNLSRYPREADQASPNYSRSIMDYGLRMSATISSAALCARWLHTRRRLARRGSRASPTARVAIITTAIVNPSVFMPVLRVDDSL